MANTMIKIASMDEPEHTKEFGRIAKGETFLVGGALHMKIACATDVINVINAVRLSSGETSHLNYSFCVTPVHVRIEYTRDSEKFNSK